jgi:hypothetical protein
MESLKSAWRFVLRTPDNIVIDQMLCRPDFDAEQRDPNHEAHFQKRFITYHYDGQRWHFAERVEPGFWEDENGIPPHANFPGID